MVSRRIPVAEPATAGSRRETQPIGGDARPAVGAGGNAARIRAPRRAVGSPVGLGILITAAGFFLLCLHWAGFVH
jgi:hypothetical protein